MKKAAIHNTFPFMLRKRNISYVHKPGKGLQGNTLHWSPNLLLRRMGVGSKWELVIYFYCGIILK